MFACAFGVGGSQKAGRGDSGEMSQGGHQCHHSKGKRVQQHAQGGNRFQKRKSLASHVTATHTSAVGIVERCAVTPSRAGQAGGLRWCIPVWAELCMMSG